MKRNATILFLLLCFFVGAQSNLTIFNNGGQQFFVILNGVKQNSQPMTNVVVSGIKNGSYSLKLIFIDGVTADIDKNFYIDQPYDITTRVVFKKKKGKLQLIGQEPAKSSHHQDAIVYRPDNSAVYSDAIVETVVVETIVVEEIIQPTGGTENANTTANTSVGGTGMNTNVSVNETSTTSTTVNTSTQTSNPANTQTTGVGINVNINVNDQEMGSENINVGINMSGTGMNGSSQTSTENVEYSQTTTVSTTSTGVSTSGNSTVNSQQQNHSNQNTSISSNTTSGTCKKILGDENAFIADLKSMTFDTDKVETIQADLSSHCLTASQAYKILETLTYEADRLENAKFLYDRMIDKDQGKTLLPLFTFEASKMEFREYMRK